MTNKDRSKKAGDKKVAGRSKDPAGPADMVAKGKTERPAGTSTARDSTGVDPQNPIDPKSPNIQRGGG